MEEPLPCCRRDIHGAPDELRFHSIIEADILKLLPKKISFWDLSRNCSRIAWRFPHFFASFFSCNLRAANTACKIFRQNRFPIDTERSCAIKRWASWFVKYQRTSIQNQRVFWIPFMLFTQPDHLLSMFVCAYSLCCPSESWFASVLIINQLFHNWKQENANLPYYTQKYCCCGCGRV